MSDLCLSIHPVVLLSDCSQGSETVTEEKQHEEKFVSSHSHKYCEPDCFLCLTFLFRKTSLRTQYAALVFWFWLFCVGWFCAAGSLSAEDWNNNRGLLLVAFWLYFSDKQVCIQMFILIKKS